MDLIISSPAVSALYALLLLSVVAGGRAAAVVAKNSAADTDELRALLARETLPSQQVVDITRHGLHCLLSTVKPSEL